MEKNKLAIAIVNQMMEEDLFSQWLGIEIMDIKEGYSKTKMTVRKEMINGLGVVHGGITFSFADSTFAFACNSRNNLSLALDTSINFLKPVHVEDVLVAEAFRGEERPRGIAGMLEQLPAASLLMNPTINSYKRLIPGWFAPVNASWGVENRSCALRAIWGDGPSKARIECRRPGADANPYLVLAGLIAAATGSEAASGEGAGKETVARLIHAASYRARSEFVPISAAV